MCRTWDRIWDPGLEKWNSPERRAGLLSCVPSTSWGRHGQSRKAPMMAAFSVLVVSQAAQLGWWLSWEDTQNPVPGDGGQVQGLVLNRGGRHRTSTSLPAQPAQVGGTVGFPVLTAEAAVSPGTQASCQAARRWTWDTVGKGSAETKSSKGAGGRRAEASMIAGRGSSGKCCAVLSPKPALWTAVLHACCHDVPTWRFSVWLGCLLTWFGWVSW